MMLLPLLPPIINGNGFACAARLLASVVVVAAAVRGRAGEGVVKH